MALQSNSILYAFDNTVFYITNKQILIILRPKPSKMG